MQDLGVGKSTFALQIAEKVASRGIHVGFVSLEMSTTQIINKIVAKRAKVNANNLRNGTLTEIQIPKVAEAFQKISELPITILTKTNSIQKIESETRKLKNKKNLGLLVIDYLQLVKNQNKFNSREQEVADISRTLKLLSLELEIPIIALCQLNRNASRQKPTLADLRESGAIEQDADNVIFLYTEKENQEANPTPIVIVDLQKQRAGGTGQVRVIFDKKFSEFKNILQGF